MKKELKAKLKIFGCKVLRWTPLAVAVLGCGCQLVSFTGHLISVDKRKAEEQRIFSACTLDEDFKEIQKNEFEKIKIAYNDGVLSDKEYQKKCEKITSIEYALDYAAKVEDYKPMYDKYVKVSNENLNWSIAELTGASCSLVGVIANIPTIILADNLERRIYEKENEREEFDGLEI